MAFKGVPETNDLRGSPTLALVDSLEKEIINADIYCWDPVIPDSELSRYGYKSGATLNEVLQDACAIVLVNNHPELDNLDLVALSESSLGPMLIYDFWGRNDHNLSLVGNNHYHSWGNHSKATIDQGNRN